MEYNDIISLLSYCKCICKIIAYIFTVIILLLCCDRYLLLYRFILWMVTMANFLSAVSEFLFKDANILIQIRDWFFAQAGNILLALILFWLGDMLLNG